jgi:ABC-type branched-subunit amino acid transport system permease subunit
MRLKPLATAAGLIVVLVLLFSLPTLLKSQYWTHVLILSTISVIMAVSLRCLSRVGQISMGSAGFMLVGAYTSALLVMKAGFNGLAPVLPRWSPLEPLSRSCGRRGCTSPS